MLVMFLFSQNHSSGLNGLSGLSGLAGVATSCYNWLHVITKVTSGYNWLQVATRG